MVARSGHNERTYCNRVSNGLDDLKAAIYACTNHTDDGMHSDHGLLSGHLQQPSRTTLTPNSNSMFYPPVLLLGVFLHMDVHVLSTWI